MPQFIDTVKVQYTPARNSGPPGEFRNFTSLEIPSDITQPSSASFELGDDRSFPSLRQIFQPGTVYKVFVNDSLRLTGRVEGNNLPQDVSAGSGIRFTGKTKLSDAMYSTARQSTRVKDVSIADFIYELYQPLGLGPEDFIFKASLARDLITGKESTNKGSDQTVALEPIKVQDARVRPPETIFAAADRHLRRHGLMQWDAPDGRIVIGAPNDTQPEQYTFYSYQDPSKSRFNNIEGITRIQDVGGMPTAVGVFGVGGKRAFTKSKVSAFAQNDQMAEWGFYRPLVIPAEAIRTPELAQRAANRELSDRSRSFDTYVIENDGLSFFDGNRARVGYAVDTVARVFTDAAGGAQGSYYVHRVTLKRDAQSGDRTNLQLLAKGLWKL